MKNHFILLAAALFISVVGFAQQSEAIILNKRNLPIGAGTSGTTNLVSEYEIMDVQTGEIYLSFPTSAEFAIDEHVSYEDMPIEGVPAFSGYFAHEAAKGKNIRKNITATR